MVRSSWKGVIGAGVVLALAACSSASSPSATQSTGTGASQSAAASPVATVPDDELSFPGKLVVCIDIPYPPQEMFDEQGNPTGADPDLATEIATRLGLQVQIENSVFDTIIAAVTSGKCDIIISAQNITADRLGQVNMIPYFKAGQAFVVAKGNPEGITEALDLCGKAVAAETGTTEVDYVNGHRRLRGHGWPEQAMHRCRQARQWTCRNSRRMTRPCWHSPAARWRRTSPTRRSPVTTPPSSRTSSSSPGVTVEIANEGISVPKDKEGLAAGVVAALQSMANDGKYQEILAKYGLEDGAVDVSDMEVVTE